MSSDEQKQLLEADVRRCIRDGTQIDVDLYRTLFPWLADDFATQRTLVVSDFQRRLGSQPAEELQGRYLARYPHLAPDLEADIRQQVQQWMQQPIDASQLDQICDQFEEQFLTGCRPVIEQYVGMVPEPTRHELLCHLLSIETYHRQQKDESIDWQDYLARFPEEADWIQRIASRQMNQGEANATVLSFHPGTGPTESRQDLSGSFVSRRAVGDFRNGRYRLLRKMGEGSFGSVYLGVDDDLQRHVALKVPRTEALARLSDVDLYLREAQMAASLDHPNIVPVYDVGRAIDGSVYIVSKLVEGVSLADYMRQHKPTDRTIAQILSKVADALHHAHSRKLIHRDIKPANILIDGESGEPYVTDFGLSIRAEDPALAAELAGSPAYMSPEQLRGDGHQLDGRSDLFSLGVVMYQLLTGRLPFNGKTREEVALEILETEPPMLQRIGPDVPPGLDQICWRLLRKDPNDRYQSGEEVARELAQWANPPRRLQRWTMGALGAALVATCLVMAWIVRKEWDRTVREAVADVTRVPFQQLPLAMERLDGMRPAVDPLLQQAIQASDNGSEERLRLTLAMLPSEPELAGDVANQLLRSDVKRTGVLLDALQPHASQIEDLLWKEAERGDPQTLLQAAAALARFASDSPRWIGIAASVSEALASQDQDVSGEWLPYLDSVNKQLVAHLLPIGLGQPGSGQPDRRATATKALERYAADDFETLHQIILEGQPWQFSQCFDEYERFRAQASERLSAEVAKPAWIPGEVFAEKVDNTPGGFVKDLFQTYGRFYRSGYKQVVDDAS
ncbi:MAG: serine/threonine-protein kinase, partial [Pirellulaceae bacterium]